MRRGPKIGPARVLQLRDFAQGLEWTSGMRKSQFADYDMGDFHAGGRGIWRRFLAEAAVVGGGAVGHTRAVIGGIFRRSRIRTCKQRVGRDPLGSFKRDAAFGEGFQFERAVVAGKPVGVAFSLATFGLSGQHYNDASVLLPDNTPKILG